MLFMTTKDNEGDIPSFVYYSITSKSFSHSKTEVNPHFTE
jgi:hypothetical protein